MVAEGSRPHRVTGLWAYVDPVDVLPDHRVSLHASFEAAARIDFLRLGRDAILEPDPDGAESPDREDVEVLATFDLPAASAQVTTPGSYVSIGGPPVVVSELTLAAWIRPWMCPMRETNQWYAAGIITDLDYPEACRFGLLIDAHGRICGYAGDGEAFDHSRLAATTDIRDRIGQWSHVACSLGPNGTAIWIDGVLVHRDDTDAVAGLGRAGPASRLRLGALAEDGLADGHLDADLSQPVIFDRALTTDEVLALVEDRGRRPASDVVTAGVLAEWPLSEEVGDRIFDSSGYGRDGVIVNGATWEIGGPAFDASEDAADYDPRSDPERGHGLRLSSDDLLDCAWPAAATFAIPEEAQSGFYAARVSLQGATPDQALTVPFVVVRSRPSRDGFGVLIVPTNTWHAYGRRFDDVAVPACLHSSFYTTHTSSRPFFELGLRLPIPRADPYRGDSRRATRQRHMQLVRPERIAEAWLRRAGYALECVTDLQLHRSDVDLDAFACVVLAGHSEYWSDEMRSGIESYLERGGKLLSLSGDTASQRVVIDDERGVISARKISDDDPMWLTPAWRGERWHPGGNGRGGRFRSIDRPPWTMLGVSTKGMIDDGTPRSYGSLTVLEPDHFLFHDPETVPVSPDGTIGGTSVNGPAVSGYEFDATPDVTGFRREPLPGLTVLARALGQRNLGWIGEPADQGADVVYWQRPDGGLVFTISSIGASGALVDAGVGALVRNVLHRFGVERASTA